MAAGTPTLDQIAAAVHELIASVDALTDRIVLLETRAASGSTQESRDFRDAGVGLVDKRLFTPELLFPKDIFREWSEDFIDYIRSRDAELGMLLEQARYTDVAAKDSTSGALAALDQDKSRNLYRAMKKFLKEHPEARPLIQYVPNRNPFEA